MPFWDPVFSKNNKRMVPIIIKWLVKRSNVHSKVALITGKFIKCGKVVLSMFYHLLILRLYSEPADICSIFSHSLHIIPLSLLIYPFLWMQLVLQYFFQPSSITRVETCNHTHMEKLLVLFRKITFIRANGSTLWNLLNLSAFLWLTNTSIFQHTSISNYFLKVNRLSYFYNIFSVLPHLSFLKFHFTFLFNNVHTPSNLILSSDFISVLFTFCSSLLI